MLLVFAKRPHRMRLVCSLLRLVRAGWVDTELHDPSKPESQLALLLMGPQMGVTYSCLDCQAALTGSALTCCDDIRATQERHDRVQLDTTSMQNLQIAHPK